MKSRAITSPSTIISTPASPVGPSAPDEIPRKENSCSNGPEEVYVVPGVRFSTSLAFRSRVSLMSSSLIAVIAAETDCASASRFFAVTTITSRLPLGSVASTSSWRSVCCAAAGPTHMPIDETPQKSSAFEILFILIMFPPVPGDVDRHTLEVGKSHSRSKLQ